MEVIWALLCEGFELLPSGALTIKRELDKAYCTSFPFQPKPFFLVARVRRDSIASPGSDLRIMTEVPGGAIINKHPFELRPEAQHLIHEIGNQVFPFPGIYAFHIVEDGRVIHTVTLQLIHRKLGKDVN